MRTRQWLLPVLPMVVGALIASCTGIRSEVQGSGVMLTESRPVADFQRIELSGPGVILVDRGDAESLQIEAEENILPVLTSSVANGQLQLGHEPFTNIIPTRQITYRVTVTEFSEMRISGSGEATITIVDPDRLEVVISGSGSVTPIGTTETLMVDISGSGTFDGESLEARTGDVSVSGSGEALVNVTQTLAASVSGSGQILYIGDPDLSSSVSGSGRISPR
jgi:hypothetical protein